MPGGNGHEAMLEPEPAVLLGQCSNFEQQLSFELRAAYAQQLLELGQSSRRFADRIASVCEREGCSGQLIARVLRELRSDEGNDFEKATPEDACPVAVPMSPTANGLRTPNGRVDLDAPDKVAQVSLLELPISPSITETFADIGDNAMDEIRELFEVPKCKFMEASGKILKPPSEFEAIFGSHLRHFYEGLTRPCWQPMDGHLFMRFVLSGTFKVAGASVILLNFFFIIAQSDYRLWAAITRHHETEADWMKKMEVAFTLYYCFELICLMIAYRKEFFLGSDMSWNWFDFIIVLTGVFELLMTALGGAMMNLSFLRVLRFFKLSRVLRMFSALRMVKDVKVMVDALTGSFIIFIFGCMLMAMMLSVFSIFFVQGLATYMEAAEAGQDELGDQLRQSIIDDFGSVAVAMRSLYMSATGGNDWSQYHVTIKQLGAPYDYLYLFFIAFTLIAFFNVITGVFAEKAMTLAMPSMEELTSRRRAREVKDAEELVLLLRRVMKHKHKLIDYISLSDFDELMSHPHVVSFFEVRCLKATTAHRFFKQMLEMEKTDKIDIGTFVSACVKLDGTASSIDLHVVSVEVRTLLMKQTLMQDSLKTRLHRITDAVDRNTASRMQFQGVSGGSAPLSRANDNVNVANGRVRSTSFESPVARSKMGPSSKPNLTDSPYAWKPTRPMGDHSDEGPFQEETRADSSVSVSPTVS